MVSVPDLHGSTLNIAGVYITNKMTYKRKLANPLWQKKRLEILERDNFTCQLCGDKETELHVHHHEYHRGKKVWEYDNVFLITYCAHCHFEIEKYTDTDELTIGCDTCIKVINKQGFRILILTLFFDTRISIYDKNDTLINEFVYDMPIKEFHRIMNGKVLK